MTQTMLIDMKYSGITLQQLAECTGVSVPVLVHHLNYPSVPGIRLIRDALSTLKANPTPEQRSRAAAAQSLSSTAAFVSGMFPEPTDEGYFLKVGTGTPMDDAKPMLIQS